MATKRNRTFNSLKCGKRYYFWSGSRVRSGLYNGETDPSNGNAVVCEKDGVRWSLPACELYDNEKGVPKEG